jgi:hypothetical protein
MAFDFDHDPLSESFETIRTIVHEESFVDVGFSDEEEMGEEERLF